MKGRGRVLASMAGEAFGVSPMLEALPSAKPDCAASDRVQIGDMVAVVRSEAMRKLLGMVERVARNNAAVLVIGETGAGKEMIARAIHQYSLRCSRPFIDVNCAALPDNLAESELFGHEKGAFSGADSLKPGLFEMANHGTLFLDEIGELDAKVQVKLLRVLDGVPYYRLGGSRKVSVDVRIVAATNMNLEQAVHEGRFRSDLFHRLNQFQLRVPPLRERPDDIEALAEFLLQQSLPGAHFTPEALELLRRCPWKGNVRDLRNVLLKAVMHMDSHRTDVRPADLVSWLSPQNASTPQPFQGNLEDIERQAIFEKLTKCSGDRDEAARQLGISRRTLTRKLQQYEKEDAADASTLGRINSDQQRYFRVAVSIPAEVQLESGPSISCEINNVSIGGVALAGPIILKKGATAHLRFGLNGTTTTGTTTIDTSAQVVWVERKRAGLCFTSLSATARRSLGQWLLQKAQAEGWDLGMAITGTATV
jgi:two-component system, NtrC family, response regulator AtoC